jgi:hypothetical protein
MLVPRGLAPGDRRCQDQHSPRVCWQQACSLPPRPSKPRSRSSTGTHRADIATRWVQPLTTCKAGYILGGGFSVLPAWLNPLEMRFDLSYSEHNASIALLNAGQQATNQPIDSGTGSILSGTGNLVYHIPLAYGVRGYGIAGIGAYYTRIELDQVLPVYNGSLFASPRNSGSTQPSWRTALMGRRLSQRFPPLRHAECPPPGLLREPAARF